MHFIQSLVSLALACATAIPLIEARPSGHESRSDPLSLISPIRGFSFERMAATREPCELKPTRNFQRMKGISRKGAASRTAPVRIGAYQRQATPNDGAYQNITTTDARGVAYAVEVDINGVSVNLIVDTGSSDTWSVQSNYTCTDYMGSMLQQGACAFGHTKPQTFQYGPVPDVHLFVQYGDGEMVSGPMGLSDVTLANITVEKQQIALVNESYWIGDNYTTGILGLGYPSITDAFYGEPYDHEQYQSAPYSPVFTRMVQQGLVDPVFSLAISRNSTGGLLGWGGIPDIINGLDSSTYGYADIIIANIVGDPHTAWAYSFYTIIPDGFQFGMSTNEDKYPFIIDSGTTVNYLPLILADAINAAFDPPAKYLYSYGAYFTSCDAVAPPFSVVIGGTAFLINPKDMILRNQKDPLTGLCMTTVSTGGTGPFILGDAFLQNVLAVFDIGSAQMRFYGRPYY
ncbi:uncharacterized protein E0L32_010496 [Thyridium curvatum]|uniref:Peptidase A1 domain-containing protein n=1 Tax=Thyridium curvatum TaxID=1093900 RepID=A0A507ASD8_9PEZI|nr:uncharacterized protein E0L32_010496 [Thyridium curvatum]TPX07809.1 hypothetical protein E0L32_010496 [Thyridium curvatum]